MDTLPAYVASISNEGIIRYINRVAEGTDPHSVIGSSIFDYITPEYHSVARECLHRVVTTGKPSGFENVAGSANQKPARYETLIAPVVVDGEVTSLTLIATDISERRALEAELLQAQKMEAVGQLSAGIAHHFNNLLQTILANIDLAEADASDEGRTCLSDAREASIQAAELVRHLLTFAGERDRGPRRAERLNPVVHHVVRLCARTFEPAVRVESELITAPTPHEGPMVLGDQAELQQALMNICINARDALEDGATPSPKIEVRMDTFSPTPAQVSAHDAMPNAPYIRIRVQDNGPGMDEEAKRRCIEPFFTTKPIGRGTGLGLSTSYRIVRDHGGWVEVISDVGRGTTFEVCLPSYEPDKDPADSQPRPSLTPRADAGRELLLLVDDDPMVRRAIGRGLRARGYRVEAAASGREALEIFREKPDEVALVIVDKVMPDQGGHPTLREIRALRPHALVVCVTGQYPTSEDEAFDAVLRKPTSTAQLDETIRRLLDQPTG